MPTRDFVWNGTDQFLWWGPCAVVAAALIVQIYRYERTLVAPRIGAVLLSLRLLFVAALCVALLEPVLTWTTEIDRSGRIVVAVDVSESMGTNDAHGSKAEKLRWARSLGLIGNASVAARLDRWTTAFEAGREPEWVDPAETADPEKRDRLARARRENLDALFAQVGKLSRKEIGQRLLTGTASPLLPELKKLGDVQTFLFAGKLQPVAAESLANDVAAPPAGLGTGVSDLSQALAPAVDGSEKPVIGVVLLSDGRDNSKHDPVALARRLGQVNAPIYAVTLGSVLHPKDLSIGPLDYPQTVLKNDHPILKVTANTSGFEDQELEVVLDREGQEPLRKKITPRSGETLLDFALEAEQPGRRQYTVKISPQPGETRTDNNSSTFALTVVDDKVRVLVLEGAARWEYRFIENALRRDTRVDLRQVVFDQPTLGLLPEGTFPRSLKMPDKPGDLATSPFAEPDLVIVGDVSPAQLPPPVWDLLEKFVAEAGGTLVLSAGKQFFPLAHPSPVVARLLPVTDLRPVNIAGPTAAATPEERGFHLRLTPDGEREVLLQFDADAEENRRIWSQLPGHLWGLFGQAKPGATVFAAALQPAGEPPLDAERQGAVIVHQHYGLGQVLWLGIDSTWRWRHLVGDRYHHRFWGQVARWAAENKAAVGNDFVKFGPDRSDVDEGDDVMIRARWVQQFLNKHPGLSAKAEFYRTGEKPFMTIPLVPAAGRPLIHEGRAVSLPAGDFRVKLSIAGADLGPREVEAMVYVHQKPSLELSNLSANIPLLEQLASSSGGRRLSPEESGKITDLLRPPQQSGTVREETPLWNHWLSLLVFFAILTAEWTIRKLNGLP